MAQDPRIKAAFDEVHANTPKAVKRTMQKSGAARAHKQEVAIALSKARAAGASIPDASGANYVSRNDLHVQPTSAKGERVPYREKPQFDSGPATAEHGTTAELGTSKGMATECASATFTKETIGDDKHQVGATDGPGPSHVGDGILTVKAVNRRLNPVEVARKVNNSVRDSRTNLGRGKAGVPTIEEENGVNKDW